jgi:hypothetical protein
MIVAFGDKTFKEFQNVKMSKNLCIWVPGDTKQQRESGDTD